MGNRRSPLLWLLPEASGGRGRGDSVGFGSTPRGEAERPTAHACSQVQASSDSSSQKSTGAAVATSTAGADHRDIDAANSITSQPVGAEKHKGKKEEDGLGCALLSVPPGPQCRG